MKSISGWHSAGERPQKGHEDALERHLSGRDCELALLQGGFSGTDRGNEFVQRCVDAALHIAGSFVLQVPEAFGRRDGDSEPILNVGASAPHSASG